MKNYDIIIVGAGSVGLPLAWKLSESGFKTAVIEREFSFSQGQNKAAIGGIRATHSEGCKIALCHASLQVLSSWQDTYGDDISWTQGGYLYPAYTEATETILKDLLKVQTSFNLNISWISPDETLEIVSGLKKEGLRGASFAPGDGTISSLLAAQAFYRQAVKNGTEFLFNEEALKVSSSTVETNKSKYGFGVCILASGVCDVHKLAGISAEIFMERHEAAITEPVGRFTEAMVVDIEKKGDYASCYFYQNREGQIIFCLSPDPPDLSASSNTNTSSFLPNICRRMLNLIPGLVDVKVRRSWCGFYPMTKDGVPFVDRRDNIITALGMCGQGLMLGPGIAVNIDNMIKTGKPLIDENLFRKLSLDRDFSSSEILK